jgi:MFS family permease
MAEPIATTQARPGAKTALVLLLTINLFNYIDRYVLAAVEPPLSAHFGLNSEQSGLLASAFLYAYMVGAPICGRLAERMSRWWIIAVSVTIWSLASGWTGLATSFSMLLVTRIIVGFGEAGYGPAAPALIADYFPIERRGRVMALFYLAIPVGSALGYVFGGWANQWQGWRWAFYLVVPPGLLLAALCLTRKEPPRISAVVPDAKRSFLADAKTLLRIPSYLLNTAAMTAMTFAIGGISFWIPKYMLERLLRDGGLGPLYDVEVSMGRLSPFMQGELNRILGEVNFTFGIIVVTSGFISTLMGGWLGDKLRKRWKGSYFAMSGAAIALAFPCTLGMISLPFPFAWAAVFGAVFFLFFNTGPANTALANVTSSRMRSTAFALNIFLIHALGDAISPPLIGWIAGHTSWDIAFGLVSLTMVLASVLWLIGARYLGRDEAKALDEEAQHALDAPPTPAN